MIRYFESWEENPREGGFIEISRCSSAAIEFETWIKSEASLTPLTCAGDKVGFEDEKVSASSFTSSPFLFEHINVGEEWTA
jgi:hypothetical protein